MLHSIKDASVVNDGVVVLVTIVVILIVVLFTYLVGYSNGSNDKEEELKHPELSKLPRKKK